MTNKISVDTEEGSDAWLLQSDTTPFGGAPEQPPTPKRQTVATQLAAQRIMLVPG